MAETDDDIVANWHDRVETLRKRGRISAAALAVTPVNEVDVRRGRPPAPERLGDEERALWGQAHRQPSPWLVRRQCQHIETALRATPITDAGYSKLARLHRQSVALAATLGTRLRLTPHSFVHKAQPTDGDLPVA